MIEASKKKKGFKVKKIEPDLDKIFTFKALVERVIDGDTFISLIDCGFGLWTRQRLRLSNVDTPELDSKRGLKAKMFVEKKLKELKFIVVRTFKGDKYDRYLSHVFYLPAEKDPAQVALNGHFLNQDLLDHNLANIVS